MSSGSIEQDQTRISRRRESCILTWTIGSLRKAATSGCSEAEKCRYELSDDATEQYEAMRSSGWTPDRAEIIEALRAIGMEQRAEALAEMLLRM